jgi:hypothetical protein
VASLTANLRMPQAGAVVPKYQVAGQLCVIELTLGCQFFGRQEPGNRAGVLPLTGPGGSKRAGFPAKPRRMLPDVIFPRRSAVWLSPCTVSVQSVAKGAAMRSELVTGALQHVPNRYLLTRLAAKAIRAFHRPNTRIAETTNDVLRRFSAKSPMAFRPNSSALSRRKLRRAS